MNHSCSTWNWEMRSLTVTNVCFWVSVWAAGDALTWGCWPFSNTLCCLCVGQMKGCIKVLKEQPSNSVEGLLNALRCVSMCVCVCVSLAKTVVQVFQHTSLCRLLLQVYDTASKWWQHLQTNQGPPAMRERRRGRRGGGERKKERKWEEETNASGW